MLKIKKSYIYDINQCFYRLEEEERDFLSILLSKIKAGKKVVYLIPYEAYSDTLGLTGAELKYEIINLGLSLNKKSIEFYDDDEEKSVALKWFSIISFIDEKKLVEITLTPAIKSFLLKINF